MITWAWISAARAAAAIAACCSKVSQSLSPIMLSGNRVNGHRMAVTSDNRMAVAAQAAIARKPSSA